MRRLAETGMFMISPIRVLYYLVLRETDSCPAMVPKRLLTLRDEKVTGGREAGVLLKQRRIRDAHIDMRTRSLTE